MFILNQLFLRSYKNSHNHVSTSVSGTFITYMATLLKKKIEGTVHMHCNLLKYNGYVVEAK